MKKNDKRIQQLQYDYNLEKKESQIQALEKVKLIEQNRSEKQKLIIWGMLSCLTLTIVIIILLYRSRLYEKRNKEELLKQKEEIQQQALKLEELNNFKDKTFSVLSHDLRGPLASFATTMMMLDENVITMDEFRMLKPEINNQLVSLNLLLDNLLNWSKSYMRGEMAAKPEITNIYSIIIQNINLLQEATNKKQITIHNSMNAITIAFCDREQIDIVIRNLLMNAIKFTKRKGSISITATSSPTDMQLTIADTGIGMTRQQLDKLFTTDPKNTFGTDGEKGTGLGLLLCYGFIKTNNGSISVKSDLGIGSAFTISLPVSKSGSNEMSPS